MALPTAQEVRDELEGYGIDSSQASTAWIERKRDNTIVPWIEDKIGQKVEGTEQITEPYSGTASPLLILNRRPILSLNKIQYVNAPDLNTSISIASILVIEKEGILRSRSNFTETNIAPIFFKGKYNILVTYTTGFDTIDKKIRQGILLLMAEKTLGLPANRTGGGNLSVQAFSRDYGKRGKYTSLRNDLAREAMALLRPFMTGVSGS